MKPTCARTSRRAPACTAGATAAIPWTRIGLDDSQQIARIIVDPADANVVFVAALGHPYGPNAERGVFLQMRATAARHGSACSAMTTRPARSNFRSSPAKREDDYAAMWQTRRTPWNIYPPANGPNSGLYKSDRRGRHLDADARGRIPGTPVGRIGVAVAPGNPQRVYAIVDSLARRRRHRRPLPIRRRRRELEAHQQRRSHLHRWHIQHPPQSIKQLDSLMCFG